MMILPIANHFANGYFYGDLPHVMPWDRSQKEWQLSDSALLSSLPLNTCCTNLYVNNLTCSLKSRTLARIYSPTWLTRTQLHVGNEWLFVQYRAYTVYRIHRMVWARNHKRMSSIGVEAQPCKQDPLHSQLQPITEYSRLTIRYISGGVSPELAGREAYKVATRYLILWDGLLI